MSVRLDNFGPLRHEVFVYENYKPGMSHQHSLEFVELLAQLYCDAVRLLVEI